MYRGANPSPPRSAGRARQRAREPFPRAAKRPSVDGTRRAGRLSRRGCPVPPWDTHVHGPAALRATRLSALPSPRPGVAQRGLPYPVSTRANRGAPGFHPFLTDRGGDERIRGRGGAAGATVADLTEKGLLVPSKLRSTR